VGGVTAKSGRCIVDVNTACDGKLGEGADFSLRSERHASVWTMENHFERSEKSEGYIIGNAVIPNEVRNLSFLAEFSNTHFGFLASFGKGASLQFPRFVRKRSFASVSSLRSESKLRFCFLASLRK
jgi:hypothetical protein